MRRAASPAPLASACLAAITLAAIAHASLTAAPAMFDLQTWTGGTGNWEVAANWSLGHEPGALDGATIDNGGTAEVTTAGRTASTLEIGKAAAGTLRVTGAGRLTTSLVNAG